MFVVRVRDPAGNIVEESSTKTLNPCVSRNNWNQETAAIEARRSSQNTPEYTGPPSQQRLAA